MTLDCQQRGEAAAHGVSSSTDSVALIHTSMRFSVGMPTYRVYEEVTAVASANAGLVEYQGPPIPAAAAAAAAM